MTECTCSCSCQSTEGPALVFPCSGGSNVGQIANAAAIEMDQQNLARIYCLAGVAAPIPGMVDSAKCASGAIAIDGCPVACAKTALENAGITVSQSIIVTELGIKKNHIFEWTAEEVKKVVDAVCLPENLN